MGGLRWRVGDRSNLEDHRHDAPPIRPIADGVDGTRRKDDMTPLDTLKTLRAAYPTPMSNDALGQLLNAVAWTHRAEGWGLLKKPTGSHCRQPQTGLLISRDILVVQVGADLVLYDVLIDAEGAAKPIWGKKPTTLQDLSRWIAPVEASVVLPPIVVVPPVAAGGHYPDENTWWTALLDEMGQLYAQKGEALNLGMFKWAARTAFDIGAGDDPEHAKQKHLAELRAALGLC